MLKRYRQTVAKTTITRRSGGGGPPAFSPSSIVGLNLWLDAADSSTFTLSGTNVTEWKDKSTNNQGFTITGTPQRQLNVTNGLPGVFMNGSSYFYNTTLSTPAAHTVYMVTKFTGTGYYGIISFASGGVSSYGSPNAFRYAGQGSASTDTLDVYANNGNYSIIANPDVWTTPFLFCEQTTAGTPNPTGVLYYNGVSVGTTNQFNYVPGSAGGIVIGAYWYSNGPTGGFFNGNFHEILVFPSSLITSQRQQVEGYLAWKWGLQSKLPGNHPYKLAAP